MKILIMGSGAVGGNYGGMLSRAGEDVTFVARGPHLDAILRDGLRVESQTAGDFVIHPKAVEKPDGSWTADLVLFCVKAYHNEQAIELIKPAVGENTAILTLQNGVGSGDQLAAAFGRDKVLLGAAYIEAIRKGPGVVGQTGNPPRIVFGEIDGSESERAIRVRDALNNAGIIGQLSTDVQKALWEKLVYISALSGMTCITRSEFVDVIDTPETLELTRNLMRETYTVARARGVDLDDDIVETTMADFQEGKLDMVSSMHLDLKAGNPLEVGVINGAVWINGKDLGIETPINEFITRCLTPVDRAARTRLGL